MNLKQIIIGGISVFGLGVASSAAFVVHTTRAATAQGSSVTMARLVPYGVGKDNCGPDAEWDADTSWAPGGSAGDAVCHRKVNLINDRNDGLSPMVVPSTTDAFGNPRCGVFAGKKISAQNAVAPGKGVSALRSQLHQRANASTNQMEDAAHDSGNRLVLTTNSGDTPSCILQESGGAWVVRWIGDGGTPSVPSASTCADGTGTNCSQFFRLHIMSGTVQ